MPQVALGRENLRHSKANLANAPLCDDPETRYDLHVRTGHGRLAVAAALLAGSTAVATTLARADSAATPKGGTMLLSFIGLDSLDPARSYSAAGWSLLDATCARLMAYPDKPGSAGSRVVPEVASAPPKISADFKTYTFTLRSGFRFSDGTPVRASAFARAINRTLAPALRSPGAQYTEDIVGAADVLAGRTQAAAGVAASGNRLVVRFTRPVLDFAARLTTPFFCAVPPRLPADPEGVAEYAAAGPYVVSEYRPGERVVLRRNRFYGGKRPHNVDGFLVDLRSSTPDEVIPRVERGEADWSDASATSLLDSDRGLAARYGVNKGRFLVTPGNSLFAFALNTSRPLFRNNVRLRRAVNFAVDRIAYRRAGIGQSLAGRLTDQYLPPAMPGFRDVSIYPLTRPNMAKAKALARGRTRSGKAILYTFDFPLALARAQIFKQNLAGIGLSVEVKAFSPPALYQRLQAPNEPYDITLAAWAPDYLDPFQFINLPLDGRYARRSNVAVFDSQRYNALMRRAARQQGAARFRAYGDLDVQLARDAAPLVAMFVPNNALFVSRRVGCVVFRAPFGALDLPAACLRR